MDITTPALLFPAISLLLLAYTNRFLTLAQVIRQLHASPDPRAEVVRRQLPGLRRRVWLIKVMQSVAVASFLLCCLSMLALFAGWQAGGQWLFAASMLALAVSLILSLIEVLISTNALTVVLEDLEGGRSLDARAVAPRDDSTGPGAGRT
ncbi:MAG: DUF2721 domain-containing protein [Rhodocyclaceae bacterium]|nr:DUF2721 domain-containing protein [Rhodocyclaceae bacterium]